MGCIGILLIVVLWTGHWFFHLHLWSELANIILLSQHTVKQFSASPVSRSKMSSLELIFSLLIQRFLQVQNWSTQKRGITNTKNSVFINPSHYPQFNKASHRAFIANMTTDTNESSTWILNFNKQFLNKTSVLIKKKSSFLWFREMSPEIVHCFVCIMFWIRVYDYKMQINCKTWTKCLQSITFYGYQTTSFCSEICNNYIWIGINSQLHT